MVVLWMVNIDKHISYWRNGAEEDFEAAKQLIGSNKIRYVLFFLHLMFGCNMQRAT
jgi:hypothetical protein